MIVVYWLDGAPPRSEHATFGPHQLKEALAFAEDLRARRRAGAAISHVALQSELAESVGPPGVADAPPGYAHYKRRPDPAIPLGRPSGSGKQA